jgi:hypothetical protein
LVFTLPPQIANENIYRGTRDMCIIIPYKCMVRVRQEWPLRKMRITHEASLGEMARRKSLISIARQEEVARTVAKVNFNAYVAVRRECHRVLDANFNLIEDRVLLQIASRVIKLN